MLERAVAEGRAPVFGEILRRGTYYPDCVSVFPSVTPAAAGVDHDGHAARRARRAVHLLVPPRRAPLRRLRVVRRRGAHVRRAAHDHRHRLQHELRSPQPPHADGVRAARRRRSAHGVHAVPDLSAAARGTRWALQGWMRRVAQAANFRQAVYGPSELFYGELYASQEVDCQPTLARPGTRDPYSGCVGAYIERYDLYDFLLFSLPDNDHFSHRYGPQATLASIERADRYLQQLADAAGGSEQFLDDHAVILMSDHAQIAVSRARPPCGCAVRLAGAAAERPGPRRAELAVAPGRALGDGLRARRGRLRGSVCAGACCGGCARSRASTCWPGWRARRRACGRDAASCGSRPGAR